MHNSLDILPTHQSFPSWSWARTSSRAYLLKWSSGWETCVLQIKTRCKWAQKKIPKTLTGEDCLVDNHSKSGIERASDLSKRSSKNCQSFNKSSSSLLTEDRYFGKHFSELMTFMTLQVFEVFWLFDNYSTFWQFSGWLANNTTSTSIKLIILDHNPGRTSYWVRWYACPEPRGECSSWWPPSSLSSPLPWLPTPTPPFLGFVVD